MKQKLRKLSQSSASTAVKLTGFVVLVAGLTACNSTGPLFPSEKELVRTTPVKDVEYGAPLPGVKIFQNAEAQIARKAGRVFVGKPYKVNGQWFYPKAEIGYSKVGRASWYGAGFHGRKTANGEIFNMNHLTAAHPTMPLPSYARVTNLKNGASVVVRVNDRGPFAHNRLIDLSKKAAETLHFADRGVADVKVDYIGPAPAQPRKDSYLLASYRGPNQNAGSAAAFVAIEDNHKNNAAEKAVKAVVKDSFDLSEAKPALNLAPRLTSAYVEEYIASGRNSDIFAQILRDEGAYSQAKQEFITLGNFANKNDVNEIAQKLKSFGDVKFVEDKDQNGNVIYSAHLMVKNNLDAALDAAWQAGANDAFIVRDH